MRKTTTILLLLSFSILISCNDNEQESAAQNDRFELVLEPDKDLREKYEQQQTDSFKNNSISTGIVCNAYSEAMNDFIALLRQDNYAINFIENQSELWFKTAKEEFKIDKSFSFPKDNFKTILVKRKNKLKRKDDNWYPSFAVSEICFLNEEEASKSHKEISGIIDNLDLFNEKDYDYILKNRNRLIYVSSGAKIFEEYAFSYKDKIEEIIKRNNH